MGHVPLRFGTTRCSVHQHPELTLVFRTPRPVPGLAQPLEAILRRHG